MVMLRYRHAAALLVGPFLVFPTLSFAQETDPIPGLPDLASVEVNISVDVPDVDGFTDPIPGLDLDISVAVDVPGVPEFTDFNVSDPGIAKEVHDALQTIKRDSDTLSVALLELLAVIKEEVRSRLQQGRVLLDSDFGP